MLGRNLHRKVPSRCASKRGALKALAFSPAVHLSLSVFRETRLKVALALQKRPLCEVPVTEMFQLCKQQPSATRLIPAGKRRKALGHGVGMRDEGEMPPSAAISRR
ncbi:exported hypothetical protein [Arthrobacter sp. 9AX]|nr:exported hypothetical protein [Arthrobacter sp. 9AX]